MNTLVSPRQSSRFGEIFLLVLVVAAAALNVPGSTSGTIVGQTGQSPLPGQSPPTGGTGQIDLSIWALQEPVGSPGSPTTIPAARLVAGYSDAYFARQPDGSLKFYCPISGVPTTHSTHPRSELREMTPSGTQAAWSVSGSSIMSATVAVPSTAGLVTIGQIHFGGVPPFLRLTYAPDGTLTVDVQNAMLQGNHTTYTVAHVRPGAQFTYVIQLSGRTVTISIDGHAQSWTMNPSIPSSATYYFKAGDYIQYTWGQGATVVFSALSVSHHP